jgi:hypothetical protein
MTAFAIVIVRLAGSLWTVRKMGWQRRFADANDDSSAGAS